MLSSYSFRYLQSLHTAERAALQCLWGRLVSSRTAHRTSESLQEEGSQLVWPPPSDIRQAHPGLSAEEPPGSLSSHSPDTAVKASIVELLKARGLFRSSATVSRSAIQQLRVNVIRAELERWGAPVTGQKPALVERLYGLVQGAVPESHSAPSSRASTVSANVHSRIAHRKQLPEVCNPEEIASMLVEAKTDNIRIIDVRDACDFTDFMILATGRSYRHIFSTANGICYQIGEKGKALLRGQSPVVEGEEGLDWLLVDTGSTIIHIFTEEARSTYKLEAMWARPGAVCNGNLLADGSSELQW